MARQVVEMERRTSATATAAGASPLRSGGWRPADITAIIELTRRPPAPHLMLPIIARTGSASPPRRTEEDPAGPLAMPAGSLRLVPPVLAPPPPEPRASWFAGFRRSEAASILGFALAWVTTTAAGALSMGHLLAGTQTPIIVHVAEAPAVAESQAPLPACPPTWTPPVVAIADLPIAGSRPSGSAPFGRSTDRSPSRSPDAPVASGSGRRLSSSPRRLHASPPATAVKAKTAPPPKSLEDWMRASVGGSASGS